MTAITWAVLKRGWIHTIHLTLADANAEADRLKRTTQRLSDIQVKPRPAVAPWWTRKEEQP